MEPGPLKLLFVINKGSGKKNGINWEEAIQNYFKDKAHVISTFIMPPVDAKIKLRKMIRQENPHRIIAVGGDGTVTFVAKEVLGTSIEMGILPAGSANGMAKELKIPVDADVALDIVLNGEIKYTDVIKLNDKDTCLHLSDIGINAQIVKYFQEGPIRGKIGYALALTKALRRKHRLRVHVQSKDSEVMRTAIMVLIANARKYGTGARINPDGDISDGMFEVVIVRKIGLKEILKMFLKFQRFDPKYIEVVPAHSATVETAHRAHYQVDGEYLGKVRKVEAKIVARQLKLLVPKKEE